MKIEIRIKDPNTTRPVTTTLAPTSSTAALATTTPKASELKTKSLTNSPDFISQKENVANNSNAVEFEYEALGKDEDKSVEKIFDIRNFFHPQGNFAGIILTVLVIVLILSIRHFIMQHRKRRRSEQERNRGDSLTTDLSFQTPHELFA